MDSPRRPQKSILKKRSSSDAQSSSGTEASGRVMRRKSQRWDEMNILMTHHPAGKDYGSMKIDEPQTPFCRQLDEAASSTSGSQGRFSPKLLAKRLMALVDPPRIPQEQTEEDSEEEGGALSHNPEQQSFEHQRKKHYDEGQHITREASEEAEQEEEEGRGGAGRDEGSDPPSQKVAAWRSSIECIHRKLGKKLQTEEGEDDHAEFD
ncbi:protein phosphatase inhibitor 2-like [Huso huso]|uniref:Protein phosphatase inhibitor 2-like n=1 Tax=Huso huso TaxID=61971 RepID=A0ABR0Y295_HUSHU